jgi:hypothetical protein
MPAVKYIFICCALGLLLGCGVHDEVAGPTSETGNTITCAVVYPDGSPASGVEVRLRPADYVAPIGDGVLSKQTVSIVNTTTDDTGGILIDSIDPGDYFLEVNAGDTLVTLFHIRQRWAPSL